MDDKIKLNLTKPERILYSGEPGYRKPLAVGEVDVWHKNARYIYAGNKTKARVLWRQAVAEHILGPAGRSADLRGRHPNYIIGELKRQGSQVKTRRRPGGDPVHAAGGLAVVDVLRPDDPRWSDPAWNFNAPGWRPPRGCVLAVDVAERTGWIYRRDGRAGKALKSALIRAFAYTSGPAVKFSGRAPVYLVHARQWTAAEVSARVGETVRRAARERIGRAGLEARARAEEAKRERRAAAKGARARVRAAAVKVDQLTIRLVDAETSLARWPGEERQAKVNRYRVGLAVAWRNWASAARQVAADGTDGGRPLPSPHRAARERASGRWPDLVEPGAVALAVDHSGRFKGEGEG